MILLVNGEPHGGERVKVTINSSLILDFQFLKTSRIEVSKGMRPLKDYCNVIEAF